MRPPRKTMMPQEVITLPEGFQATGSSTTERFVKDISMLPNEEIYIDGAHKNTQ